MSDCSGDDCNHESHGLTLKATHRGAWCTPCTGTGKVRVQRSDGEVLHIPCPQCLGTGNPHESVMLAATRAARKK